MTKTEELQKQIDEMTERKIEIVEGMKEKLLKFVLDTCNVPSEIDTRLDLDVGFLSRHTKHEMKRVKLNFYLHANRENSTIRVVFEDGKMYIKNNTIAGLSKEDDEDLVYIVTYNILYRLLADEYNKFKSLIINEIKSNIEELESISSEKSILHDSIRRILEEDKED